MDNTQITDMNDDIHKLRVSFVSMQMNIMQVNITDNKKFWGTVKPYFSNKVTSNTYITLNEDKKLI